MAKLYFRYSAMNAGKSTSLIQVAYNYEERGGRVLCFTSNFDTRKGDKSIFSRIGVSREAMGFSPTDDFRVLLRDNDWQNPVEPACILIDEAQFLTPEQAWQLHEIAHVKNIPTICYGLRSDFKGTPFLGSAQLLAISDTIEEIKNICGCGRKATMNVRIDENGKRITTGEQIAIEGDTKYTQLCGRCWWK